MDVIWGTTILVFVRNPTLQTNTEVLKLGAAIGGGTSERQIGRLGIRLGG